MNRIFRNALFYLVIVLVIIGIVSMFSNPQEETEEININKFQTELQNGNIESLTIQPELDVYVVRGQFKDAAEGNYFTVNVPDLEPLLVEVLNATSGEGIKDLNFKPAKEPSAWMSFLTMMIPFIIIIIIFFFLISQAQGGGSRVMNFGKSKAKLVSEEKKKARFKDVAGADEEKQELVEVVEFLKEPRKFAEIGARIPKGVLLVGPPGTGKTLLARAVAGEAGVPFFSISGSDFVEMFVGVGASRVRDLFENAMKNAPCIIFIDEIDAVGRRRGAGVGGGHDEREQTLNQLLVEMDGFGVNEGIILIAATNRADILDPALLRPGRFDRQIMVGLPDIRGREAILKVHTRKKPLEEDVDLGVVAKRTPGFTPADLENLVNEAALLTARFNLKKIPMHLIEEASIKVQAGPEKKSRVISPHEKKLTAYHEAGHALTARLIPGTDPVHLVTIIPRGMAGGFTAYIPEEDRNYLTKNQMRSEE